MQHRPGTVWCPNRRALLTGLGGLGTAGLLTACGAASSAGGVPPGPSSPPGASSPAVASSSGPPGPPGGALVDAGAVPVGGGTVVSGVLVVQPEAGTFKAYDAACPHKGVQVTAPQDGVATCPAHRSTFSIKDGSRMTGPATSGLTEIPVRLEDGKVVRA